MSLTAPEQPAASGQDPQATPDPTPAAAPPAAAPVAPNPAGGTGPWANDLATTFADDGVRGQVDEFLRSKVQPYTTRLEQQSAQAQDAVRLQTAFQENPVDAYVQVTYELFGEEAANAVLADLQQRVGADGQQPPQASPEAPSQPLDPQLQKLVNWAEEQQTNQYYEQQLGRITTDHPEVDTDLFHPFVAAAGGDFDAAYGMYNNWLLTYGEKHGTPAEVPAAPTVLGSDTQTAQPSSTPVEPQKQSLNDAIDDMASWMRTNPAPPVGSA